MGRSIRFRVTALATLVSLLLLIAISLVMVWVLRSQLTENFDEGLVQRADTIAIALPTTDVRSLSIDEDLIVQVIDANGRATLSHNLDIDVPIGPDSPGIRNVGRLGSRPETFRVLTRRIDLASGAVTLHVAGNFDDVDDPARIVARLLLFAVPGTVIALGVLTWWLTGRTLSPVERMRKEMSTISATNLARRVPIPNSGDEIARLAKTMNDTLDRLEASVERQNRFVADASHELRSPLTRIRSEIEVDLAHPSTADLAATHRSVLAEAIALQHLVSDLLQLARADMNANEPAQHVVDLDDVVAVAAQRARALGRVRVDTSAVEALQVAGDERQLSRAVGNLLDNAERHAATEVTVLLTRVKSSVVLTVYDDGAGIAAADRQRVFERFTRLDEARTRDAGGSGLGLAIAREIFERHGGTIAIDNASRFVVTLPAASQDLS